MTQDQTLAQDCEITSCVQAATEGVEHPQHGDMAICPIHAENIRRLNPARFAEVV